MDAAILPPDTLTHVNVGLSVSTSADLPRLGLQDRHAELAIGEITRAVLVAGGSLTYGGRIKPSGFTQQLMNEVRRYGTGRHSLTICLAWQEHRKLTLDELDQIDRQLGTWGRLIALNEEGRQTPWRQDRTGEPIDVDDEERKQAALSGLRRYLAEETDARVLVGGQLAKFQGSMPGLVEEAMAALEQQHPVYCAGGFGGAAAAAGLQLIPEQYAWLPEGLPAGRDDPRVEASLKDLGWAAEAADWKPETTGLTYDEHGELAASHRPGDVASLVVRGLSRRLGSQGNGNQSDAV